MEEKLPSAGQSALFYGLLYGVAMVILHLVLYLLNMQVSTTGSVITFIIMVIGVVIVQLDYRNKKLNGYITYGKALKIGLLTLFFAGIIYAIYQYIYSDMINPGELLQRRTDAIQDIYNREYSPEQEAQAIKWTEMGTTPLVAALSVIIVYPLMGLIISLITSIFIKKEEKVSLS